MSEGLFAMVDGWAKRTPGAEALTDPRGSLSYADLAAEVRRWAGAMAAMDVGLADRVLVLAPPGRESLISLLAADSLGATWCGLDPKLRAEEIGFRIADLRPKLILSFATLGGRSYAADLLPAMAEYEVALPLILLPETSLTAPEASERSLDLDVFLARGHSIADPVPADEGRAAIIVYTSGSSGKSKGAMLAAPAMLNFAREQNRLWPAAPMRTLNFLPVSHDGAIVDLTIPTLAAGGSVIFQRKFDARASLELIARERVSFWASVPSTFIMQTALPEFAGADLSSVQIIAIEGAAIPPALAALLVPIAPIATNYGMTETCSAITAMPPTRSIETLTASVGAPFGGAEVRIDGAGREAVGEILVRSPRNLLGYWNEPDATRAAFTDDGFFRTGDLGELLPGGQLRLRGRKREMFKSGGYNISPAEVEAAIALHADVEDVAVVPVADPLWQEVGVAFVMPRSGAERDTLERALHLWCEERLANYKRPKRFILRDALPLLSVGKIDRQALRLMAEDGQ